MQIFTERHGALVCLWLSALFVVTGLCYGGDRTVEVVGVGECADCKQNNIKTGQAFSGLGVTVECKSANGHFKRRGAGELDGNGNFKVSLPHDFVIKDGELKEECYAQLHSASSTTPCPANDGNLHDYYSKIVIKSKDSDHKYTLGLAHKLKFSSLICTSAFFWPFFKHHHPHFSFPPIKVFPPFPPKFFPKHPLPPPVPFYKAPPQPPPPSPTYEKPPPQPVPVYKKPPPSPVPIGKKPFPPPPSPPPISKPLPPPTFPIYEHPFFKHLPPFLILHPPLPKIPQKYFHHPKFGKWPPLPPFSPHS